MELTMYITKLAIAIAQDVIQSLADNLIKGIYGPTYIFEPVDLHRQLTMPHTVNIYRPIGEPNVMVRLVFSHRGEVDKVIDCRIGVLTIADLPWGGTLYGYFTGSRTKDTVSDVQIHDSLDIIIGDDVNGRLVAIVCGNDAYPLEA